MAPHSDRHDLVSVSDAARQLGISVQRVRALIADESLEAYRVGSVLLVSAESLARRNSFLRPGGRPWSTVMAWSALLWLDHELDALSALSSRDRWRLRQRLSSASGLDAIASRLARRAVVDRYLGHSSIPGRILDDGVRTGVSASPAHGLDLIDGGSTADLYVPQRSAAALQRRYRLIPAPERQANVILRVVPDEAWLLDGWRVAPRAAVALDLLENGDSRSRAASSALAERIWREVPR